MTIEELARVAKLHLAKLHRYTITSEGASKGYFRLVEDPQGAWLQWPELSSLIEEVAAVLDRPAPESRPAPPIGYVATKAEKDAADAFAGICECGTTLVCPDLGCEHYHESRPAPLPQADSDADRSVVLAADAYAQRCAVASGPFEIGVLVNLKSWFYAGARWRASRPDADVVGPQSVAESRPAPEPDKEP